MSLRTWFVQRKLQTVAWLPGSQSFAAASADEKDNTVSFWRYGIKNDSLLQASATPEPVEVASASTGLTADSKSSNGPSAISGTVVKFIDVGNKHLLLAGLSSGSLSLYDLPAPELTQWRPRSTWRLHVEGARTSPLTALDYLKGMVVTVGEDGKMNFLNVGDARPVLVLEDVSSISSVACLSPSSVATTTTGAQVTIWDVNSRRPALVMKDLGLQSCWYHCLSVHPTDKQIIATGASDGTVTIWDQRTPRYPLRAFKTYHQGSVFHVRFSPVRRDELFSAGADAALLHWNFNKQHESRGQFTANEQDVAVQALLKADACLNGLDIDTEGTTLLAASDGHGLFFVPVPAG